MYRPFAFLYSGLELFEKYLSIALDDRITDKEFRNMAIHFFSEMIDLYKETIKM